MNIDAFVEAARPLGVLGVKVTIGQELVAQWHLEEEMRRNVYSATKSFTSAAVGFALQEGLLTLEEKLVDVFPAELPEQVNENLAKATVRDLLTMCLGQEKGYLMGEQRPTYREDDWIRMSLAFPFVYEPNTHFVYNNVGPYLAGVLVQRRSGCDLASYLRPRLLDPLGIKKPTTWETDPFGYSFGAGGLFLTLSELHTFGQFYLKEGNWNGKQLLSKEWIAESTRKQVDAPYGYLFWRGNHNSYRADGKYCQLSIVVPDKNAVVSMVSECRQQEALMDAVDNLLLANL